jgi:hypothetical protein
MKNVQTLRGADIDSDHTLTSCKDLHYIEENHKVPKGETKMGFGFEK